MIFVRRNLVWILVVLSALFVTALALGLGGGMHGMYADDYVYRYFGSDAQKTDWTPNIQDVKYRVLAIWLAPLLAPVLPDAELPVRVGLIAVHLLNVLLLAWLAFRLTGSHPIAVIAGGGFLVPLFAYETLLWFSAGIFYLLPLSLLLIGFHLILSCTSLRQLYLVLGAIVAWLAMILFIESGLLLPLLTLMMSWMMARRGVRLDRRALAIALGVTYPVFFGYSLFVLQNSPIVAVHGQSTLDPVILLTQRIPEVIANVLAYAQDWLPRGIYADAFLLGTRTWAASILFWVLILALGAAFAFALRGMVARWEGERSSNARALIVVGAAWFVLGLAPVLFIRGLAISSRVMLFPSAGLALAVAGIVGWLIEKSGAHRKAVVIAAMVVLFAFVSVNALSMAGLLRVYQLRWSRDQQQFAAFRAALPALPPGHVSILAHALDQTIVQSEFGRPTVLDDLLYGLFDTPWAIDRALWLTYGSEKIAMLRKDAFGISHVVGVETDRQDGVTTITFQGTAQTEDVPVSQLLAFTYRKNGFAWLDPLVLVQGEKTWRVSLPLIEKMGDVPKREAQIGVQEPN